MQILVVDDYQENRYLLEVLLKGHGHNVVSADNGIHAMEHLLKSKFDLIISDILMPLMDGYQFCLKCKTDSTLKHIPFIFYTATYTDKQDEELALKLGADRFIRKPADPDEFMSIIRNLTEKPTSAEIKPVSIGLDILHTYTDRVVKKLDKKIVQLEDEIKRRKEAEHALRESEAKYRSLVETGGAGIAIVNLDSRLTFVNDRICQMLGYSHEELLNKPINKVVYKEDMAIIEAFLNAGPGIKSSAIEFRGVQKSGDTIWLYTNPTAIKINGVITGYNAVIHDISALKLAEAKLQNSLQALQVALDGTVSAMAKILELKDPYTSGHQARVAELASAIARKINLSEEQVKYINTSAVIHDIGKLYVPSDILSKPGKLNDLEFKIIQEHPQGGYDILKNIDFGAPVAQIVLQHHERIDGSGYPRGLKGEEILMEAKILAVADVVEAMSSHRPYRAALGIEKAMEEIMNYRGIRYDEAIVNACLELINRDKFSFKVSPWYPG